MSRPLLPPRGIFVSTRLLFDRRLSSALKETTLQLMALAWGSSELCTPPVSLAQLAELTGKGERTLRGHLLTLEKMECVVSLQHIEQGMLKVTLVSWLFRNDAPVPVETSRPDKALPEEDRWAVPGAGPGSAPKSRPQTVAGRRTRRAAQAEPSTGPAAGREGRAEGPGGPSAGASPTRPTPAKSSRGAARLLSKKFQAELMERGLFPTLLPEVTASPYSEADLRALLAWCSVDAPERPAGLFMGRLRAGACAPAAYRSAPCSVCGQYGKHALDCRRRFAQDIYNSG